MNNEKIPKQKEIEWLKLVNRKTHVAINYAIATANSKVKYVRKFKISPLEYLWYNSITGGIYYSLSEVRHTGELLTKQIKNDNKFASQLSKGCIVDGENLVARAKSVSTNPSNMSSKQLTNKLQSLREEFYHFSPYLVIPHSIENVLVNEINSLITDSEARQQLLEPIDVISEEQLDELALASKVKKNGWNRTSSSELTKLTENYCWLPMVHFNNVPFDTEYFRNVVNDILVHTPDPKNRITSLRQQDARRKREYKSTLKELKASNELINLVSVFQSYIRLRTYRMNVICKFNFYQLPLLYEIASRIDINEPDVAYLTYSEMLDALKNKISRNQLVKLIRLRQEGFAILGWEGNQSVISGMKNVVHAIDQYNIVPQAPKPLRTIKGKAASKGIVTGRVKVVRKLADLDKVETGDVLVAKMTTPDYMIAINRVSAIVTDEGGVTCHAAIVSREFNVPCIVGTHNATHMLNDNDLVKVNATKGIVKLVETLKLPTDVKAISGKTIYKGKVRGTARIILDASDFYKIQDDDIIIATQTTPEYLSMLHKTKGFVVDEDSIYSHAVLYGKALKLPSIMGTSFARSVIQDGDQVELDATSGLVEKM